MKVSVDPDLFHNNQSLGAVNDDVRRLQQELKGLNLFKVSASGKYGEVTENAVFKFQQTMGIVDSRDDFGAGIRLQLDLHLITSLHKEIQLSKDCQGYGYITVEMVANSFF